MEELLVIGYDSVALVIDEIVFEVGEGNVVVFDLALDDCGAVRSSLIASVADQTAEHPS